MILYKQVYNHFKRELLSKLSMKGRQIPFALRVSLIYALVGGLWILLSDKLVDLLFQKPEYISIAQTFKGWFFILVTALMLFAVLAYETRINKKAEKKYADLFQEAVEGVFRSTPNGRFISINPAMAHMFGYSSPEEMLSLVQDISPRIYWKKEDREKLTETLNRYGVIEKFEAQMLRKDGSVFWTSINAHLAWDDDNNPLYDGFVTDITQHKIAELILQQTEERYRTLVNQMPAAVYTDAPDKRSSNYFSSPQILSISGYSPQEWVEDAELWIRLIHPDDRQKVLAENERTNQTREPFDIEYRIIARDGRVVWVHDMATLICDDNDNPLYWQGILINISEQKQAVFRLQAAEKRYRVLVERLPAIVFMDEYAEQQTTRYVSPRIHEVLGYTPEEWTATDELWQNSLHPEDRERVLAEDIRTNETGEPFRIEYRIRARDGNYIWIREEAYFIEEEDGKLRYWQGLLLDITDQKRAQEALKRREAILEAVSFAAEQFLKSTNWEDCASRVLERLGKTVETSRVYIFKKHFSKTGTLLISQLFEWVNEGIESEINNQDLQNMDFLGAGYSRWVRLFDEGLPAYGIVKNLPEGEQIEFRQEGILSIICFPIPVENDWWGFIGFDDCKVEREWSAVEIEALRAAVSMLGAAIQRKLVEEMILRGESSYRGLFNSVNDAIYIQDLEGHFLDVNEGALRLHGYEKNFFIGRTLESISPPGKNDLQQVWRCFQQALQGREEKFEFWGSRGNGEIFPSEMQFYKGTYFGDEVIIAVAQDVTERKRADEALQRQLQELTVLHAVAMAESTAGESDELLHHVTDIIGKTLYPDNCGILLLNKDGSALQPHSSYRGTTPENLSRSISVTAGISGRVATTRRPIRFGNVQEHPDYYEVTQGICSELCVPIISSGNVLGVLNIESKQPEAFSESDERLLNTIAGGLATALERLRFFELEKKRQRDAETLREATSALTSSLELPHLYETILDSAHRLVHYDSASIHLEMDESLQIVAGRGLPEGSELVGKRYPLDETWDHLTTNRRPLILPDAQADALFEKWDGAEYIRGWIGIPLIAHDKFIGLLSLDSRTPSAFSEEHATLLQTFANQAAVAIENGRLFETQRRRRQEAEALREATASLTATVQFDELFEIILSTLAKLIPYTSASIELVDGDQAEIAAQHGLPQGNQMVGARYPYEHDKWGTGMWQPIIVADVRLEERFTKLPGSEYIRGWMGVPLIAQEKLLGYINLDSDKVGYFTEEHSALAQTFANQAAVAIENVRTLAEERRRTRIIEALADIANEITRTGEVDSLLETVAQRTLDLLKASHVAIYLLQDDNTTIRPATAQGTFSHEILSHVLKIGEGITGNIVRDGKSEIINDTTNDPRRIRVPGTSDADGLVETMMSSALILRGKPIGAINAWRLRSEGLFNKSELNFLISIAHQTSVSMEAGRLFQEAVRHAQETAAIVEVGRDISATLQLDVVLERIGRYAKELLRADTSAVYLFEPAKQSLRVIAAFGKDAEELKNFSLQLGMGIVGSIALSKKGEIVNNTLLDPRGVVVDGTQDDPHEHIMAVPVLNKDELTGLLAIWRSGADQLFIPQELEFLASLAQQAAIAIENARLFQSEQRRREEAENLRVAATAITSTLEPGQVLETILVALQQVVPYDSAAIFQLEGEQVRVTAAKGFLENETLINRLFPANNQLFLDVKKNSRALILEDNRDSPYFEKWAAAETVRAWMGVPLIARGQVIGYITMDSVVIGAFGEKDALLAQTFAHQAAAAIENARLFNETRQRVEELEVVSRVSVALRVAQDSQRILLVLIDEIQKSMGTDTAAIWLYDRGRAELVQKASSGELANLHKPNFKAGEGIVGYVFESGKVHQSLEFSTDAKVSAENVEAFRKGWGGIAVPIRTTSETIGVLVVAMPDPQQIERHQIRLLRTIAEIAGNAINRSSLYEKSEEQVRRLTMLRELDTAISSSFDLRVTLDILIEHLLSKMGVSAAAILILDTESQTLTYHSGGGFRDSEFPRMVLQHADSPANQILLSQREIYIGSQIQRSNMNAVAREGFVSYYGIPLQSKGLIRGVLETYFRQPFTPNSDWRDFLRTLAGQATIAIDNTRLFENLQRSNQELSLAYDTTLEGWSKALELRDKETQGHSRRVTDLTLELARQMGIPESQLTHIRRGVLLHDIGKMGVPDNILRKNGPLTDAEWIEMRKHPQYAFDLLNPIHYLRPALDVAYYHHEWWDGSGYPSGLKGNNIPLAARIFAVVDVWDALLSNRPYRTSWTKQKVIKYLRSLSGKQFDPAILEVFLKMMKDKTRFGPKRAGNKGTSRRGRSSANVSLKKNKKMR